MSGDAVARSKAELFGPNKTGRRGLARHYGDGFGKHLLSAVGRRLTSCMRLTEADRQRHKKLQRRRSALKCSETHSLPVVFGVCLFWRGGRRRIGALRTGGEREICFKRRTRSGDGGFRGRVPRSSLSMMLCSPFSKEMASAGLWNVRPNFRSSTRQ